MASKEREGERMDLGNVANSSDRIFWTMDG